MDIEFPAWSPGRYYIYDFARNVQEMSACGENGGRLPIEKIAKGTWRAHTSGEPYVQFTYRMFGDSLSGTFSQLDDRHAAINGSSLFGYIVGRERQPIELIINDLPQSWKIYSSLKRKRRAGELLLVADNYDLLIDSPIEIGTPLVRRFELEGVTYHVVLDIAGSEGVRTSRELKEQIDRYLKDTEKVVDAFTFTFGRPEFDDYYFLVNIDPFAPSGDGMEHLSSTRLVINGYITDPAVYHDLVGVTSHEFFHIWNVKRLRPAELGPFNYAREHHTTLLWFAEGFTQYYGHLMLRRAGVWDEKQFYKELLSEINTVDRSPGRFHRNLRQSSFDTWHAVGARNPMGAFSNFKNTYVNYYHKGAVVALLLDLEIRRRSGDRRSLDDVIRELYQSHYAEAEPGEYFLRGSGFTEEDVYRVVEKVAGEKVSDFLRRQIESVDEIDYGEHLEHVGLGLVRTPRRKESDADATKDRPPVYIGLVIPDAKSRASTEFLAVTNVLAGSPAERAGLSAGDLVVAVDGERVDGSRWEPLLGMKRPGEELKLTLFRGSRLMTVAVRGEQRDMRPLRIEPLERVTTAQKRSRKRWLEGEQRRKV